MGRSHGFGARSVLRVLKKGRDSLPRGMGKQEKGGTWVSLISSLLNPEEKNPSAPQMVIEGKFFRREN